MIGSGIGALKDKYNNYQKTKAAEAQRKAINPYEGVEMTDASTWGQNNHADNVEPAVAQQPAMVQPAAVQPAAIQPEAEPVKDINYYRNIRSPLGEAEPVKTPPKVNIKH
jgi:hypothetical protein